MNNKILCHSGSSKYSDPGKGDGEIEEERTERRGRGPGKFFIPRVWRLPVIAKD